VHVIVVVARVPDETVGVSCLEHEVEGFSHVATVVGAGKQLDVVHHPRVAVEVAPPTAVRRLGGGSGRHGGRSHRRHVVEQSFAVEVEVAHVAIERRSLVTARFAEEHRVHVQGEVLARQLR